MKVIILFTVPYKEIYLFLYIYFPFYHNISVFISLLRTKECSTSIGVLFTQEVSKKLMILSMDYDVALSLEK